jgi:cation diffusion facilitator family transporter
VLPEGQGAVPPYAVRMSPQRRIAVVSVAAACLLIAIKLASGLASGSLGLLSEALHSGTDLVAALLTFFALGVAGRPADPSHPYGHGKAEHLGALAEASILVVASLAIVWRAVDRLVGPEHPEVDAAWWTFAVLGVVIVIDLSRAVVSRRGARRHGSAALSANALHFAGDLGGTLAVLVGLGLVRAGYEQADSVAALLVAMLVLAAAGRLMRENVDVLMDRSPAQAQAAAREAIEALEPPVDLRRLRLRSAGGRYFADVVIGVLPGAAVAQGHAVADAIEDAVERALPGSDVVVHVEPRPVVDAAVRERALEAALRVPRVREIHNVVVRRIGNRTEVSLHLKLPGDLSLGEAHGIASRVEGAIREALPEIDAVQTHLEPLAETARGIAPAAAELEREAETIGHIVRELTGAAPRELRFLETDEGLVALLTVAVEPGTPLAAAHARASALEEEIRLARPEITEVLVHTEP